tara:strand:- start:177 stop:1685 length:1509 start_codon:yes stop_codon:yes gene_type:complete
MNTEIPKILNNQSIEKTLTNNKELPQNIEAEQNVLGSILYDNESFDKISESIMDKHFYDPLHKKIFSSCSKLINRGQLASPITLKAFFTEDEINFSELESNRNYLQNLIDGVGNFSAIKDYAQEIKECFFRRELIRIGSEMINDASDLRIEDVSEKQIEQAESKLYGLAENGLLEQGPKNFEAVLTNTLKQIDTTLKHDGNLSGLDTGLIDLNSKLGGLHASDLLIIAGRPGMGKTALATNIAFHVASQDNKIKPIPVLFFSLEMSSVQLATRILSERSNIDSEHLRTGKNLNESAYSKLIKANTNIYEAPFYIDETPAISISQIASRSRRLKRQLDGNLGLIVVDYIQLIMGQNKKIENRVQELSAITRGLKAIAKELNIPVIALSQLSRAVEQREDKRPNLADLRESGSIEQDADVVMFVFREDYYLDKMEPIRKSGETEEQHNERFQNWKSYLEKVHGQAQVIIAKQRHGPIGTINLSFTDRITKFGNLIRNDNIPDGF